MNFPNFWVSCVRTHIQRARQLRYLDTYRDESPFILLFSISASTSYQLRDPLNKKIYYSITRLLRPSHIRRNERKFALGNIKSVRYSCNADGRKYKGLRNAVTDRYSADVSLWCIHSVLLLSRNRLSNLIQQFVNTNIIFLKN